MLACGEQILVEYWYENREMIFLSIKTCKGIVFGFSSYCKNVKDDCDSVYSKVVENWERVFMSCREKQIKPLKPQDF